MIPAASASSPSSSSKAASSETRGVHSTITVDDNPIGGYTGDYVIIYNPDTNSDTRSTGNLSGLIETSAGVSANAVTKRSVSDDARPYIIDIDSILEQDQGSGNMKAAATVPVRASYNVGSTKTFTVNSNYSPTGSSSIEFKCLYVGQHCYIWTPTTSNNTYPLDTIDESYAKKAADEFDSKFDLMQSSFGNHTNGTSGDGKLNMLYYNIDDGWQPGQGYVAGFFWGTDLSNNGVPMLNIDTYPGVYYKNANGVETKRIDGTFSTMVHEYQHLICYSNTRYMSTWLNESFSAAAEEICYPGSSVVARIQSWENYFYSNNNDWLDPPAEFQYTSSYNLHNGYSMYAWNNNLDDILALYAQVSMFAQYLYSQFGNTIYKQISSNWSMNNEVAAITAATGMDCSELVKNFRVAVTANAAQSQYNGIYGFKAQPGYDPSKYHDVQNPWDLLAPVVFTGTNCSIQGGGAITVKPVNGVYYPPSGADASLKYVGIKLSAPYTVTAVSNNTAWGTVAVNGYEITATPAVGYYVANCEVTVGNAITNLNVNTITVSPSSNCTIRVNFAPKPTYTVNYMVNGQTVGTQSAKIYDTLTLPSTVSVNPSGWTFCGWTAQQILTETTTQPEFYAPGASYTVTGNVNLNALYTRREGNAPLSYRLVETAPADWAGNYVISYGTNSSMYLMKAVNVSSDGENIETSANATNVGTAGATLENTALYNVDAPYVFTMQPHGNYYTLQNASTGTYYGLNASEYISGYLNYTASNCDWTPGVGANASGLKCAKGATYPYLGFTNISNKFWASSTVDTSLRLWKETGGYTDYYHTNPIGTSTHTHVYGGWTSNNNGTHSRSCSCGDTQTEACTYTDVVTAPTATSQGYTTHTCTVCGYSYKDSYTAPVTPTTYYTVRFSVPDGVSAPASQTVAANGSITLPVAAAPAGYSFLGWTTATVNNATTMPTILTGSYKPTANVTLKAVYSYTEGGTGAVSYQLVTSAPANWAGNYVITNGNSTSMYVLKGVTPSSNGAQIESSANTTVFSGTGMGLSNNALANVTDAYVFTVEANGSYYTVKSASTGAYLGMTSSSYLGAYTGLNTSYCNWTPAINASGAAQLKNAASGSYPYLGFASSGKYFWSASSTNANVLRLWRATASGTTYYTTSPNATTPDPDPVTTYTVSFSVPSGVTAPASQTVTENSYISLPTAAAPAGYTFLGWVTAAVNNSTVQPSNILTGYYKVTGNITLRALYSYTSTSSGSGTAYELLTSAPADWTGNYVITYGTNTSSLYAMKGLSGDTKYESSSVGGAVLLSNTGMSYADSKLTGVTDAYVFNISADNGYYTIKNASTGTYVANYNYYLWARSAYASNTCRWTLSCNNGNMTLKNATTNNYPYLSFYSNSKYFMVSSTAPNGLYFWKQTTTGGTTTTYYTT